MLKEIRIKLKEIRIKRTADQVIRDVFGNTGYIPNVVKNTYGNYEIASKEISRKVDGSISIYKDVVYYVTETGVHKIVKRTINNLNIPVGLMIESDIGIIH